MPETTYVLLIANNMLLANRDDDFGCALYTI